MGHVFSCIGMSLLRMNLLRMGLLSFTILSTAAFAQGHDETSFTCELPADFPEIVDQGGHGAGEVLTGFGGIPGANRYENRTALRRTPVVLLHGNGGHATHTQWGVHPIADALRNAGYNDAEVWAVSYLGSENDSADMPEPYKTNIADVRRFIDAVRSYLGVDRVDVVAHSLGAGMAKAYILGLHESGAYLPELERTEAIATLVSLSGAFYGLGPFSTGEFRTGSPFEQSTHLYREIFDDTPFGSSDPETQVGMYPGSTAIDTNDMTYVALWARKDFVDLQHENTSRLVGADLNQNFFLGFGLPGHAAMLTNAEVFETYLPFLNRDPQ